MVAGLTLVVAGLGVWALGTQERNAAPASLPLAALPVSGVQTTASAPQPIATRPEASSVSAVIKAPASSQTTLLTTATERAAVERRAQAARERAARDRQRMAQAPEPRPEASIRPADPVAQVVVPVAQVAAQAPPPATTVDQACAASSNFITRELCRIRACGNPAMSGDPVCVRFREMEEASRSRLNQ